MRRLLVLAILIAAAARGDDLRLDYTRQSLLGTHAHYQQFINGLPVIGGERVEGPRGTSDALARHGFSHVESAVMSAHGGDVVYLNVDGVARLAIREISNGLKPVATFFDAATGARLLEQRLYFEVAGRVFLVNPVARLNDPSMRDQNDAPGAVPDSAYTIVDLPDLAPTGPLTGPFVRIVDNDLPFTSRAEASQSLLFDRSQPQFEEANAYFHIDRTQRYLQSIGFAGTKRIIPDAIYVDAHAINGADNSFYATGNVGPFHGAGQLYFGDGGVDDAEDSDIMLHEFGHAIHDSIAPNAFNGASASEGRAMAEGFGDYWGFSQTYVATATSGRDPYCIGDWDARCFGDNPDQRCGYPSASDCLRRVDGTKTMADYSRIDSLGIEHDNGEIWSSALREIFVAMVYRYGLENGRRMSDRIIVESLFGALPNATFASQANKLLAAEAALDGTMRDAVCRAMTSRGILAISDCVAPPRGEYTVFQSTTTKIHIDDVRAIDRVLVRVQVAGASKVTLVAPDGTKVLLSSSLDGTATFGLDAVAAQTLGILGGKSAAGDWILQVEGGQLRTWSLMIRFEGDAPLLARPTTTQLRKHIPVVGHLTGAANTPFMSDVRIFNRSTQTASLIAIFTPSNLGGIRQFDAVRLSIAPNQVMALDDIVANTFFTSGLGSLELMGDTDRVIVTGRAYTTGTYGDSVPALNTNEAGAEEIAPLHNSIAFRSNVGVDEVTGGSGVVRFTFSSPTSAMLGAVDVDVAPFGHVQVRVPVVGENLRAHVSIVSGNPIVFAYGSVTDNRSADTFVVPAASRAINTVAIASPPGSDWTVTYWSNGVFLMVGYATPVLTFFQNNDAILTSTVRHLPDPAYGWFAPALLPPAGPPTELLGLKPGFRATVNMVNFSPSAGADATVIVYDAAGTELQRSTVRVAQLSLQQVDLGVSLVERRVEVRGTVAAFASLQDVATNDLTYIAGQY